VVNAAGFYKSNQIHIEEPNLVPSNIAFGATIYNVPGNNVGSYKLNSFSLQHRSKVQLPITLFQETVTDAGQIFVNSSSGYRAVPKISGDDDGFFGSNVTFVNRATWSNTTCGTSQPTIEDRILDCYNVLGAETIWRGDLKGNSGQGTWKLVSRTGATTFAPIKGREVWRDERTGLLWSSKVATSLNWCKASGSNYITNNPTAEDDPNNFCDSSIYQTTGAGPSDKAVSACFEDGQVFFTDADIAIDPNGKAGLNLISTPKVAWRLPTIYDYKVADVNGIRFVMPDSLNGGAAGEWSSTIVSDYRLWAWTYGGTVGYVYDIVRTNSLSARCVGR